MLFNIVKDEINKNKKIKESGHYVGIPIPFPRLAQFVPIIEKGQSIGVLAATGAGKSRFCRWLFIYHCYKFYKETGYPIKIIFYPLEDSKEKVYRNMICHYLHELYGIYINLQELDSKGDRVLPNFVQEKLEEATEFFKEFETVVSIVDGMHQPTEIFNYCKDYALQTGKIEKYYVETEGRKTEQVRYVANNNVHTIIVIDNMSNIDVEDGAKTEREAMVKFCKTYVRGRLCNFFKFTVVQVLQQDFDSERQSFTKDGASIVAKLKPSLAALGESKTISRSMHLVFGIFHPARFGLIQYPVPTKHSPESYRLDILGNRFRSLSVLKANDTDFGMEVAFNFDAVSENMTELPALKTPELENLYEKIIHNHPEKFSRLKRVAVETLTEDDEKDTPF